MDYSDNPLFQSMFLENIQEETEEFEEKAHAFFGHITKEKLKNMELLKTIYAPDCVFKDPFNTVHDLAHIQRIYLHSYKHFEHVKFFLDDIYWPSKIDMTQMNSKKPMRNVILSWRFELNEKKLALEEQPKFNIKGTSLLIISRGLIISHEDFWDPVEGLWSKISIISQLMKFLNSKLKIK
jgi:hypothetical protein